MDERIALTIHNIGMLEDLSQFETNAGKRNALTDEVKEAIQVRSAELGRALISERIGLNLTNLSPAEDKIVQAVKLASNAHHDFGLPIERRQVG